MCIRDSNGTVLFISHDRTFIDAVADRIILIEHSNVSVLEGNYSANRQDLFNDRAGRTPSSGHAAAQDNTRPTRTSHNRLMGLEAHVRLLERQIGEIEQEPVSYTHLRAHETDSYLV